MGVARVQELAGESAVAVTWHDGFSAKFHKLWLRDHCTCSECLHPETKQRQIDTASIALDPALHKLEVNTDGAVSIAWDDSVVRYQVCCFSVMIEDELAVVANGYDVRPLWDFTERHDVPREQL